MKDIYCYPKTDVLINKFEIHDKEQLDEAERNITFAKLLQAGFRQWVVHKKGGERV